MPPTLSKNSIAAIVVALVDDERKVRKKRKWCKNWLLQRRIYTHMNLLKELRTSEPSDFKNYLRMDNDAFNLLLEFVRPKITRQDTKLRDVIRAEERLAVTLRYLATGNSYEDLKCSTAISPQAIGDPAFEFISCNFLAKFHSWHSVYVYWHIHWTSHPINR